MRSGNFLKKALEGVNLSKGVVLINLLQEASGRQPLPLFSYKSGEEAEFQGSLTSMLCISVVFSEKK